MGGPTINDQFPISDSLSPPRISKPVYECAEAVHLTGFVPHAIVRVYAGGGEQIAEEEPPFGFADVPLWRRVGKDERLTATQIVLGKESGQSSPDVIVEALPASAITTTRPVVGKTLYECGRVVPVSNLVPSTRVHVTENAVEVGVEPTATPNHPVVTTPLHKDGQVTAQQLGCEGTDHQIAGLVSDPPVTVKPAPDPVPAPAFDEPSLIPGNDVATLTKLLIGATVRVTRGGAVIGDGLATAESNWIPLNAKLDGSAIQATQELCGKVSPPVEATPKGKLNPPVVVGPICNGARHVVVRATTVNAVVVVLRNGGPVGYAGAGPGDVVVELGAGLFLQSGQKITAIQYLGSLVSLPSNVVEVVRRVEAPAIEILGGHPFFFPKGEEQPIEGPVFPRGAGPGPDIRVQACCQGEVHVRILDPKGQQIAELAVTEVYPGYYAAGWPWSSTTGWAMPGGIPVGRYTVVARSSCVGQEGSAPFFVIFDPAEVGGPPRFSFDHMAVWFGAGNNSVRGLHYYLHPSDARVFMPALNAASGHTDPYAAAHAVARAEEALFDYDLSYHGQDVLHLITSEKKVQCADDACCLTAFLRAVGIPAHPATADASAEHIPPGIHPDDMWSFDTWTEFLARANGVLEWRIFHPHQYPNMTAESRNQFGTSRSVATKKFNDIVVMANEFWPPGELDDGNDDATYGRNQCFEPSQQISKAPWIDELCEAGYWSQTHWDCIGVHVTSLRPASTFGLDEEAPPFGGRLTGTLHLENDGSERRAGTLRITLIGRRPEAKRLAEVTYAEVLADAALEPGEAVDVPFALDIPETVPPGQSLLLQARLDDELADAREVSPPVGIEAELDWDDQALQEGEESIARLVLRNVTDGTVRDVRVEVEAPFAVRVEQAAESLGELEPGQEREVSWTLHPVGGLESGSLHVAVATANSGSLLLRRPFRVVGAEPTPTAQTAVVPLR